MAHPGGRPTDYRDDYCKKATKLCLLGATDQDLADFFEVTVTTIQNWKISHPEFFDAIKAGKEIADTNVAKRLYARACGYEHDDVDIRVCDKDVVQTPIRKYYPPDTAAAIFWLKNRRPDKWRDKHDVEHSGTISLAQQIASEYDGK